MKMRGFGKLKDGRNAGLYILRNASGMEASVTDFGATLVSLVVPDAKGERIDVVLGYGDVSGYEDGQNTYGGTVGRFANRIGNAKFELNGETYDRQQRRQFAPRRPRLLYQASLADKDWFLKCELKRCSR